MPDKYNGRGSTAYHPAMMIKIKDVDLCLQSVDVYGSRRIDYKASIAQMDDKFADIGKYVKGVFNQEKKPSGHRLIKFIKPVRDFTRMYQIVNEEFEAYWLCRVCL